MHTYLNKNTSPKIFELLFQMSYMIFFKTMKKIQNSKIDLQERKFVENKRRIDIMSKYVSLLFEKSVRKIEIYKSENKTHKTL